MMTHMSTRVPAFPKYVYFNTLPTVSGKTEHKENQFKTGSEYTSVASEACKAHAHRCFEAWDWIHDYPPIFREGREGMPKNRL